MRRVVVTGMGIVSTCGIGLDAFWAGLCAPAPERERRVLDFDPSEYLDPKEARQTDRFAQFSIATAQMAFDILDILRLLAVDVARQVEVEVVALDALPHAVDLLAARVKTIYLHLDLDVLDPDISPGVNFSEPGGITPDQLFDAVKHVIATDKLGAVAIANFNPDRDRENRTLRIARRLVEIFTG